MRPDVRRLILAAVLTALAAGGLALAGCGASGEQAARKAADESRATLNKFCDARQKAIEALGAAGAE